jgi:uncharacterized protein (DUF4415 family)/uncharacterized DUF497 family protein
MDIEFDPKKDASNLIKHGIRLARASEFSPVAILEDTRKNYGETRYRAFGFIGSKAHALAFTVTTESLSAREFAQSVSDLLPNRKSRTMTSRKKADADNPEWTRADFARAKAPGDVLPTDVLSKFGKHRGPQKAPKKVPVSIRLSPIVVTHFRNQGPGWQARIDAVLTNLVKKEKGPASTRIRKAG